MENQTRHKLEEAQHFLSMMERSYEDDKVFAYNLSAFLSSFRSITFYMQKQYKGHTGFAQWYCQKQIEMAADPELEYMNEVRVEEVHKEPVPTGATVLVSFGVGARFRKEETPPAPQGEAPQPSLARENTSKVVKRFFPKFKDQDVIAFCKNQLTKLSQIVTECENRFKYH